MGILEARKSHAKKSGAMTLNPQLNAKQAPVLQVP